MNSIETKFFKEVFSLTSAGHIFQATSNQTRIDLEVSNPEICDQDDNDEQCDPYMFFDCKVKTYIRNELHKKYSISLSLYSQRKINDGYITDFCMIGDIPIVNMAIEIDGHDWHEKTKEQAKKDKERSRYILRSGYPEIRFTGSEVFTKTQDCVKEMFDTYISLYLLVSSSNPESYYAYICNNNGGE